MQCGYWMGWRRGGSLLLMAWRQWWYCCQSRHGVEWLLGCRARSLWRRRLQDGWRSSPLVFRAAMGVVLSPEVRQANAIRGDAFLCLLLRREFRTVPGKSGGISGSRGDRSMFFGCTAMVAIYGHAETTSDWSCGRSYSYGTVQKVSTDAASPKQAPRSSKRV